LPAIRPRDLLTDGLLERLRGSAPLGPEALARDIGLLREAGYLSVALPAESGGLDCTLRQAACGQRRLAGAAPLVALAVSAHLYWTGAAADALRSGDESMSWIVAEAARGATFGAGHDGSDLKFAAPGSRCVPDGTGGYDFRSPEALSSPTPGWDWLAVHALAEEAGPGTAGTTGPAGRFPRRAAVLAFAGRGARCTPVRVARVLPAGAPSDVFTTSAIGWGCALLASVEFAAARRAFRQAVALVSGERACRGQVVPGQVVQGEGTRASGHPLDRWPVAEASLRLDAMKARIADVTHPWPRVPEPGPDLGGQHLISVYAMRREVTEGSSAVRRLAAQVSGARAVAGVTPRR
jgi:alkylation response protein AidB-like acyl-CoA dehydrogenase